MEMERKFFGLTRYDVKQMAFQLTLRNNLPHPFSRKTNIAGRKTELVKIKFNQNFQCGRNWHNGCPDQKCTSDLHERETSSQQNVIGRAGKNPRWALLAHKEPGIRTECSHVAFMKPFKTYYNQEIQKWLSCNEGRIVTQYEVAELMGKAYVRAATISNAMSGFRATGIYPLDDSIFTESKLIEELNESPSELISDAECAPQVLVDTARTESITLPPTDGDQLQKSGQDEPCSVLQSTSGSAPFHPVISPKDITALPKVQPPPRKRKGGESVVLTSSSYKKKLEYFYTGKGSKNSASAIGTAQKTNPPANKKKAVTGKRCEVSSPSESERTSTSGRRR
ncbi:hypothetical protein J437_LFUL000724 [Ladona fulva]|uniref:Uncharacterized protein n=1 Tax=Ladona fulva TaxID=123851 RepID=A0A8K0JV89_LADFU|nr:hypothetical protein J437_LFUL000724 [Ladona fulva]